MLLTGVSTSLRPFFAHSAAIALNTRLRVCLTVATPFDRMACKVKSWLSHISTRQLRSRPIAAGLTWPEPRGGPEVAVSGSAASREEVDDADPSLARSPEPLHHSVAGADAGPGENCPMKMRMLSPWKNPWKKKSVSFSRHEGNLSLRWRTGKTGSGNRCRRSQCSSAAMSFPSAIPWPVALRQSLPPLHRLDDSRTPSPKTKPRRLHKRIDTPV